MEEVALQFRGVSGFQLQAALLAGVGAALAIYGLVELARRRARSGLISLAAAAGGIAPALLIDGLVHRGAPRQPTRGATRSGASLAVARVLAVAATAAVITVAVTCRRMPQAVWMAAVTFQVVVAVGVFYASVYSYLGTGRLAALMALRCAAILALMLALFKPALSFTSGPADVKPYLPVVVDRSASMAVTDAAQMPPRYRRTIQQLNTQRRRLTDHFQPVWHHFAASLDPAESLDALHELRPDGPGTDETNIAVAVRRAAADYPRADLAGVLLLTDGLHNTRESCEDASVELGVPVYAAGVGSAEAEAAGRRNIEIASVEAPLLAVKNNVATIKVRVKLTGFAGQGTEVRLLEGGIDQPADVAAVRTGRKSETVTATLKWTPKTRSAPSTGPAATGDVRSLRLEVPAARDEAVSGDNGAEVHVLVTEPRIRVLYVEGSIRPEYKFLRRRLAGDPNVQLMALVRISESNFWAYGGIGGRKLNRLPTTDEDFDLFDVLILGDIDATFLARRPERMRRIRTFVNDGGGLIMLGGHNSFGPGGYADSDVEAVLPVLVGKRSQPQETTAFLPRLTAAGRDHAIFQGLTPNLPTPDRPAPAADAAKLPDLSGCVSVVRAKTGASVLAVHPTRRNAAGPLVVLAVQRFGAGRTAAFTADTTWRWYMPMRGLGADSPYQRFWGQLVRWLARADTQSREAAPSVLLRADRGFCHAGQEVALLARVQTANGKPLPPTARVDCAVVNAETGAVADTVPLAAGRDEGIFTGSYKTAEAGTYRLRAAAEDEDGRRIGRDELPLQVARHSREMDKLALNRGLLETMASKSGGRYEALSRLPELVDGIIKSGRDFRAAPKARIAKLYHFTSLFLLFVGLMTLEWLLRRHWQLH